jgi:predicted secreted protein
MRRTHRIDQNGSATETETGRSAVTLGRNSRERYSAQRGPSFSGRRPFGIARKIPEQIVAAVVGIATLAVLAKGAAWIRSKPWDDKPIESTVDFGAFSSNGKYFMFEEKGRHSKPGATVYSSVRIVNVSKNETAEAIFKTGDSIALARKRALDDFGPEKLKVYDLQSPTSVAMQLNSSEQTHEMRLMVDSKPVTINLIEKVAKKDDICSVEQRMFELTATVSGRSFPIQDDTRLRRSRGCAYGYKIVGAFVKADRLAVIIRVFARPENRERDRFIAATATMP